MAKLLPALALLLVSALTLSTATYAWFSMNTEVTVTGMQVTAKSESTYLVISQTSTLGTEKELDLSSISGNLLPVSYATADIKNAANTETLVSAGHWFTATGLTTSNGTAEEDSQAQLTITEASNKGSVATRDYYAYTAFYIGLAEGSANVTKGIQADVTFDATSSSNLNKCLTVVIDYSADGTFDETFVYNAATGEVTRHSSALQSTSLITTTATQVKVYIYFDGENANCTTANAINLNGINIDIAFVVNDDLHS